MITAGCDVGALTSKAVLLKNNEMLGFHVVRSRARVLESAREAMHRLLEKLGIPLADIDYCVSTGYGRSMIPFARDNVSEIACHARGAQWLVPSVRTVIDGGGQDCKAIRVDEKGKAVAFRMNTKCAAGTGRSLELMAEALGVLVSELGPLGIRARSPVVLQEPCCILTEIEIRHLLIEGANVADIAAGINDITARRILHLVRNLGAKKDIAVTGGIAKNTGVVQCLERALEAEVVQLPCDPLIIGALGAALHAGDRAAWLHR